MPRCGNTVVLHSIFWHWLRFYSLEKKKKKASQLRPQIRRCLLIVFTVTLFSFPSEVVHIFSSKHVLERDADTQREVVYRMAAKKKGNTFRTETAVDWKGDVE